MSENNTRANSRLNRPGRKKKTNTILNILIGIVLLLIIVVVVNIVTGDDSEKEKNETETAISDESVDEKETSETSDSETETDDADIESVKPETNEESSSNTDEHSEEATEDTSENTEIITESSSDPNVESVIIDPSWTPIGTSQSGEHTSSYDSKSVDWAEKVQALAYGAGIDESNMYVKFLGNGGSPQKSIGTVTSKDGSEIYRIYLEWVDGEGWKPTKKEVLKSVEDAS